MEITIHDIPVGYEEDFTFVQQPVASYAPSRSFSCASTISSSSTSSQGPFTPTSSGRSTPGSFYAMMMEPGSVPHENPVNPNTMTPPSSVFGSYFPADSKSRPGSYAGNYEAYAETPSRRSSMDSTLVMDFSYSSVPPHMTAGQILPADSSHQQQQQLFSTFNFAEPISTPNLGFPMPGYPVENNGCDTTTPMWDWQTGDGSFIFAEGSQSHSIGSPSFPGSPLGAVCLEEHSRSPSPTSRPVGRPRGRRTVRMAATRQRTTALYKVQGGCMSKVPVVRAGSYECPHLDCAGQKKFKRKEHLKRHIHE